MTDLAIVPRTGKPPRPLGRQPAIKVTPTVRQACKLIVSEGLELDQAAKRVGLTTRALRLALERPHVLALLKSEREVFRAHVSAQNIHRAKKLRDKSRNQTAIMQAIRYIDDHGDPTASSSVRHAPGVVIQIVSNDADRTVTVNARELRTDKGEQDQ